MLVALLFSSIFALGSDRFDNGYPEHRYHQVLDLVESIYGPEISLQGGTLTILRDWQDGAVNMWAERWGDDYRLEIPGGMSRYYLITEDAFVLSVCHELGHLLGGAPARGAISYEGQSDYWAAQSCIGRVLGQLPEYEYQPHNDDTRSLCQTSVCRRVLLASLSLTSLYAEIAGAVTPQISTPSSVRVDQTLITHPPAQCRLDTFVNGYFDKARPGCWYNR